MKCPRCNSILVTVEYDGIEVEQCSDCHGEWLHAEELQKVVEHHDHVFNSRDRASVESLSQPVLSVEDQHRDELNCPHCETVQMERFCYGESSGIHLHKCAECGGIWADKDQLERVEELVEDWKAKLDEDTAKYGPLLKKVAAEERKEMDREVSISRFGFVNAMLRRLVE